MIKDAETPFAMAVHSQIIADNVKVQSQFYDLIFNELAFDNLSSEQLRKAGDNVKRIGIGKAYNTVIIKKWVESNGLNLDLIKQAAAKLSRLYVGRATDEMMYVLHNSYGTVYKNYQRSVSIGDGSFNYDEIKQLLSDDEFETFANELTQSTSKNLPIFCSKSWMGVLPEELELRDGQVVINLTSNTECIIGGCPCKICEAHRAAEEKKTKKVKKRRGKRV